MARRHRLRIVELWARFRDGRLHRRARLRPGELRLYVDFVRWLAREELRLFSKGLGGRVDQDELVRIATEGIEISTELVALLHHATLLRLITESSLQVPGGDDDA